MGAQDPAMSSWLAPISLRDGAKGQGDACSLSLSAGARSQWDTWSLSLRAGGGSQGNICGLSGTVPARGPSQRQPIAVAAAVLQTLHQNRHSSCRSGRQIRDGAGRGQQILISWLSSGLLLLLRLRPRLRLQ